MKTKNQFRELAEELAREELEKASQLIEAGYSDQLQKVIDGEIDIDTAMQIFGGRRP
jgi:glycerol dehydrogenase-like iron-containing ADH family enzyme